MIPSSHEPNAELARLEAQRQGRENWRLWGPYLSERAWGTVREDYSADGEAWLHFDHDQAASPAYRWGEDGIAGICDDQQRLCFALALWNGRDPILKERLFGLTGKQGNRGEEVKECYFHLEATPSHSWMRYLDKYPQCPFPYAWLVTENARRGRAEPPATLIDSGAFREDRDWDVEVRYAKADQERIHVRPFATNRGPQPASLWLLPSLWFRNTWSWGDGGERPELRVTPAPPGAAWAVVADHPALGRDHLYGRRTAELLCTGNETSHERLRGNPNPSPYAKDAFHRYLIAGDKAAIDPQRIGTKFAAVHRLEVAPGETAMTGMVLSRAPLDDPFAGWETIFSLRQAEAALFFDDLLPQASMEDHRILRRALSGLVWSQQY
jgi:hypothetical protein